MFMTALLPTLLGVLGLCYVDPELIYAVRRFGFGGGRHGVDNLRILFVGSA